MSASEFKHESQSTPPQGVSPWDLLSDSQGTKLANKNILIVDDEATIRDVFARTITRCAGCQTHTVSSGEDALETLKRQPCDVVFLDMVMPGIQGLELIRAIKQASPATDIIVITGFVESFPYVDVIDAGACDVIAKPSSAWEIEGKLLRVLREQITREQLLLAEEKYRSLFELSLGSNVLLDAKELVVMDANRAFLQMVGLPREDVIGLPLLERVMPDQRERVSMLMTMLAKRGGGTIGDIGFQTGDGHEVIADASLSFIDLPSAKSVLVNLIDITERRRIEEQLATAATTDKLTGLPNRRAFDLQFHGAVLRARRDERPLSLLLPDLDNFKQCNDTHGHQTGDKVLKVAAEIIREYTRDGRDDTGFRLGGDEFAVVLSGAAIDIALRIASRMREAFEARATYGTTLSIGIAEYDGKSPPDDLFKAADAALYQAKAQGKNTIRAAP